MSGIKRTPADVNFSRAKRESEDYICENCGKDYRHEPHMMDCSHIFSRKHRRVRWHPLNALCLCRSCHQKMGDKPPVHAELAKKKLGEEGYWELMRLHNEILKIPKTKEKDIAAHYKAEHKRLIALRMDGQQGRLELRNWE